MDLPREVRYRPYEDWSTEELAKINNNVKNLLGMLVTTSNQNQDF